MQTGYDNYWMCNRQGIVPSLLINDNISRGISLDSYKQIQDERQQSLLTRYLSSRSNIINKNLSILSDQQIPPQHSWIPTACGQYSRPYNHHNCPGIQQKDSRIHYQRSGTADNRGNIPQISNNVAHLAGQNSSSSQTPRIRVRDVNSLNNMARSSIVSGMQERQFDRSLSFPYNVNERQQNLPQKSNTEHANHIPSLFEVNPFQPAYQRPTQVPKQSVCREQFDTQQKRREPYISGKQYHPNNITRNEPSSEVPTSFLDEILNFSRTQLNSTRDAEMSHNPPTVNNNETPANTTKKNNFNITSVLERSFGAGQSSLRNTHPHSETSQIIEGPLTTQGSALPIIEPISPPPIENNVTQPFQPIRVTAVISVPDLSSINCNNASQISVPQNGGSVYTPDSTTKECENPTRDISFTVSNNESLIVKEEVMLNLKFLNEESNEDIVIQPMKTELIQDENLQKTESNKEKACSSNNMDKNGGISKINQMQKDKLPAAAYVTESEKELVTIDPKSQSNYKSKINRDKLDRLIEFLYDDSCPSFIIEESSEKCNSKKPERDEGTVDKLLSYQSVNAKEPSKVPRVEITRCSSEPLQNVTSDDCLKKSQNDSGLAKRSEGTGNSERAKIKSITKNIAESTDQKDKSENKRTEKKKLSNSISEESQTETVETTKNPEKMRASVTQSEKPAEKDNCLQGNQSRLLSLPTLENNDTEKAKNNEIPTTLESESKTLLLSPTKSQLTVKLSDGVHQAKDTGGTEKTNLRIFPNFNYHFCSNCNIVSPIAWFWINAVTGDLKCLSCFKKMLGDSAETSDDLPDVEAPPTKIHNSPFSRNTSSSHTENRTKQSREYHKEKRKSVDDSACQERKEKKRKADVKFDKKEYVKLDRSKKCLSKDRSQSPKAEVRLRKNSTDQTGKSLSKDKEEVHAAEEEVRKKRRSLKEGFWPKKIRTVDESVEGCGESHTSDKLKKKLKDCVRKLKAFEVEIIENKGKSISKEKDFPIDKEKKPVENKKSKHLERNYNKTFHPPCDGTATKPLKEKQNTKMKLEKSFEKQKKNDRVGKSTKEENKEKETEEKKLEERKSSCIKGPLHCKDFVLNKAAEGCFPQSMESFHLRKIMDTPRRKLSEKKEERAAILFAKLKKKTKTLSLNLLKDI